MEESRSSNISIFINEIKNLLTDFEVKWVKFEQVLFYSVIRS